MSWKISHQTVQTRKIWAYMHILCNITAKFFPKICLCQKKCVPLHHFLGYNPKKAFRQTRKSCWRSGNFIDIGFVCVSVHTLRVGWWRKPMGEFPNWPVNKAAPAHTFVEVN
jgi:hypothetical protein